MMECDTVTMPLQGPYQRLNLDTLKIGRVLFRLIRDDDIKIGESLAEQAGENNSKAGFTSVCWNQYINFCHDFVSSAIKP